MKKLFFSALVAVVAVGGALTANAISYSNSSNATIVCNPPETLITCTSQAPLYQLGHGGETAFLVNPADYASLYKQN